jgi:outer membrane protein assembly factor BamB
MRRHLIILTAFILAATALAEGWPTLHKDNRRSGVTPEQLTLPLRDAWVIHPAGPPQPAWEGPAKWDAYSGNADIKSMRNFDPAYFVTAVGDAAFFGSSVDDAVHCIDANTGETRWSYFTDGAVRIPPTWYDGKLYFGSDDGRAYCVDAETGDEVWVREAADDQRFIPVNGKLVSQWPVRTGVLVHEGVAYYGASLLPWDDSFLTAADPATGEFDGEGLYRKDRSGLVLQGPMLATNDNLYALQGRNAPILFERPTGKMRGPIGESGGAFAILTPDDHLLARFGSQKQDTMTEADALSRDKLAHYDDANRILVDEGVAYLQAGTELRGFDRAKFLEAQRRINELEPRQKEIEEKLEELEYNVFKPEGAQLAEALNAVKTEIRTLTESLPEAFLWRVDCDMPHALIKAGNTLFTGGDNVVAAFNAETGERTWEVEVDGAAHGLTVANGKLYISTDRGTIYAFETDTPEKG